MEEKVVYSSLLFLGKESQKDFSEEKTKESSY